MIVKSIFQPNHTIFLHLSQTTAGIREQLQELRKVMSEDGVHFSAHGYSNLANRSICCLKTIMTDRPKSQKNRPSFGEVSEATMDRQSPVAAPQRPIVEVQYPLAVSSAAEQGA
jgi:hypothetical protein